MQRRQIKSRLPNIKIQPRKSQKAIFTKPTSPNNLPILFQAPKTNAKLIFNLQTNLKFKKAMQPINKIPRIIYKQRIKKIQKNSLFSKFSKKA